MNQYEPPDDERKSWHSSEQGLFPCPGKRLEDYIIALEKVNFHFLSQRLATKEVFYSIKRSQVEISLNEIFKKESVPKDEEKFRKAVERLLGDMYKDYEQEFFKKREIRILLNQYRDLSYKPFLLGKDPKREEIEEFERRRIAHGLRKHALSCEPCIAGYDELLSALTGNHISNTGRGEELENLGVLNSYGVDVFKKFDAQLLRMYQE